MKKQKKTKNVKKLPTFAKVILNIFYQIFIFIFFIILILVILYFIYKYGIKYMEEFLYNIKLTDIYFDESKERKFDYNFRINDYLFLDKNFDPDKKFKIIDIFTISDILDYIFLKVIKADNDNIENFAIISVYLKDEKLDNDLFKAETIEKSKMYKYHDPHNILGTVNVKIEQFKYVSSKKYFIPFYMEYIFINYDTENYNKNKQKLLDYKNNAQNINNTWSKLKEDINNAPQRDIPNEQNFIQRFSPNKIIKQFFQNKARKEFKEFVGEENLNDNIEDLLENPKNYFKIFKKSAEGFSMLDNIFYNFESAETKNMILNLLTNNFFDSDVCNLKLKYSGSKEYTNEHDYTNNIVFRGIYFEHDNKIYRNEYEIISKNFEQFCSKEILKYNQKESQMNLLIKNIINNSNQPNLFMILIKACINMSSFKINEKFINLLSFFFPQINFFIEEIILMVMENKDIYTSKKINVKKEKELNKRKKLLLLDYNIILYILSNSTDDFIRIVYKNYYGICYFDKNKLIYIKLNNKEEKKKIYNII